MGVMHFFAQLSNSELQMGTRVRKEHVLRMLKQADGAKIDPVGERLSEQERQNVTHEYYRAECRSSKQAGEKY